jgi:hypothetical protein
VAVTAGRVEQVAAVYASYTQFPKLPGKGKDAAHIHGSYEFLVRDRSSIMLLTRIPICWAHAVEGLNTKCRALNIV